jgi:hypothetical protein
MSRDRATSSRQAGPTRRDAFERLDPEDGFYTANLFPKSTGLDHVVWVSPRMGQQDIRIEVCAVPGDKMILDRVVSVLLRPTIRESRRKPQLSAETMDAVARWATLNEQVLQDYWDEKIDTGELMQRLQKLP